MAGSMIDVPRILTQDDINAYKQRTGLAGSIQDANPIVRMQNALFAALICTAIDKGAHQSRKEN